MAKRKKIHLECSECKRRNYVFDRGKDYRGERLSLKKFCNHCKAHTIHIEAR